MYIHMWNDLMKQPVNFRLNQRSMAVLESLVQSLGISKTQVVEEALNHYVQQVEEHTLRDRLAVSCGWERAEYHADPAR